MGIKGINEDLNKHEKKRGTKKFKGVYKTRSLEQWSSKCVCIDMHGQMYIYKAVAQKRIVNSKKDILEELTDNEVNADFIRSLSKRLFQMMVADITPVLIFDGENVPKSKDKTRAKRRSVTENRRARVDILLQKLTQLELIDRDEDDIDELKMLVRNDVVISSNDVDFCFNVLQSLGFPCFKADGEAEKMCCMLTIEGLCAATYSKDSDCYAYGCPELIRDIGRDGTCQVVYFKNLIKHYNLTYLEFRDLCIASGCDHNESVKMIGFNKVLKLIRENGSIDDFPKYLGKIKIKRKNYSYKYCREYFDFQPTGIEFNEIKCKKTDDEHFGWKLIEKYELDDLVKRYKKDYKSLKEPTPNGSRSPYLYNNKKESENSL